MPFLGLLVFSTLLAAVYVGEVPRELVASVVVLGFCMSRAAKVGRWS